MQILKKLNLLNPVIFLICQLFIFLSEFRHKWVILLLTSLRFVSGIKKIMFNVKEGNQKNFFF